VSVRLRLAWWRSDNPYRELRKRRVKLKWIVCRQCGQGSFLQVDGYYMCVDCVSHIDRAIADRERRYREQNSQT
jgi:hypothetical protein